MGAIVALWPSQSWPLLLLAAVLGVRMALNAIDGELARRRRNETRLGALLNDCECVVSDSALYLPLALVPGVSATLVLLLVFMIVLGETVRFVGLAQRRQGLMAKPDRAFAIGTIAFLLGVGMQPGPWLNLALGATTILIGASTLLSLLPVPRESEE